MYTFGCYITQAGVHYLMCTHSAQGRAAPKGIIHAYQAMHECLCYNYYDTLSSDSVNKCSSHMSHMYRKIDGFDCGNKF